MTDEVPVLPRSKRLAAAAAEVSSLSPSPRGIDARALAAAPPTSFKITRIEWTPRVGMGGRGGRRGGISGSGVRGRAGRAGLRGSRGQARAQGVRRRKGGKGVNSEFHGGSNGEPYTPEEQAYIDSVEMGVEVPYQAGVTVREALELELPPLATHSAPDGLMATIVDRMRAVSGRYGNEPGSPALYAKGHLKGTRTLFVYGEDLARDTRIDTHSYETLDEADKQEVLQNLVAGQYPALKQPTISDTLGAVETYGLKNETYLPKEREALKAKVQKLLPASKVTRSTRQATRL
jgi:hypothetical protein